MKYNVVLNAFEGPLDLLLHLIEKAKVDIYDIPISEITDQYMEFLNKAEEVNMEITSEFLVMASTLLEIKSKMLLPSKKEEDQGLQMEMEEIDPRTELVKKLVEYKKYKKAANKLKVYEERQNKVFYKPKEDISQYIEEDIEEEIELDEMNLEQLVDVLNDLLDKSKRKIKPIDINEIQRDEVTLEECIRNLKYRLNIEKSIRFSQLFDNNSTRSEIIVTFLSTLELAKLKYIKIKQKNNFSDILLVKKSFEGMVSNG
ncbi:segregation and condensation protein A [Anaerosalibacter massiliensis]|uniref:Segregation and condensation protein A n=1 Tax=Anaerosalibacter massiliensis TaxID=1347392 RepID=A0A9X2S3P5_9FIRM|nr:segregation/condensation protein A [Anaerosalibacter massiliensis]MCR2042643.1 segregation/condensation protein A [Anaerosalibacter massiliensis]